MTDREHWSLRRQITEHFREAILSGKLPPGSVIPPSNVVAREFGTSTGNVHRALSLLVAEGLISRRSRQGTVVNARRRELNTVAFCTTEEAFYQEDFIRILAEAIRAALNRRQLEFRLLLSPDPRDLFAGVRELLERGEIQGLIASGPSPKEYRKLLTLQTPFAVLSGGAYRYRVDFTSEQLLDLAFASFRARGVRRIGFISTYPGPPYTPAERHAGTDCFFRIFTERSRSEGFEFRPEWGGFRERDVLLDPRACDRFAYDWFERIWSGPEVPEGLLVCPDKLSVGVLMGVLHQQVRVPEQLHLILHWNRGVDRLCPVAADRIEVDPAEVAEALVEQLFRHFRGETPEVYKVNYHWREGSRV